ncbi:MAG: cytochrome b/b6 domain-containing protein [Steroidobacteraceae bacterium]
MGGSERRVLVWDAATRLFHWTVVALVVAAYVTWRLNWMDWHVRLGDAALAAVLFRILWGFFGSDTTRFARFVTGPRAALLHLAHALRREPDRQAGHNPAGGWMVLLLVLLLLAETLTGLYVNNEVANQGPLSALAPASVADAIDALHGILWNVLLAAAALHVLAVAGYGLVKRQDLLTPMFTGRKRLPASVPVPRIAGPIRALIVLASSALLVTLLATFL